MTKIFKYVAISEGISYLLLLANMLFIKPTNLELYKSLLFPIGMSHGILFIAYLFLAVMIKARQNWSFMELLIVLTASLVPFGTFFIEKKYLKSA